MRLATCVLALTLCVVCVPSTGARSASASFAAANDVIWTTLGEGANDSMPIGNGDLGANVWTERNGDIVLLVAKADAWTEVGKLAKLGRLRIRLTPNPFANSTDFRQVLRLEDGMVEMRSGADVMRVWADANRPVIHVEAELRHPAGLQASIELWRKEMRTYDQASDASTWAETAEHSVPVRIDADTVLPAGAGQIAWCHFNRSSIYPVVLEREHLSSLLEKYTDPLLHRCFGAALTGPGLISSGDRSLKSAAPARQLRLDLVALTEACAPSPQAWRDDLDSAAHQVKCVPFGAATAAHRRWWRGFWDRSWMHATGPADAVKVSQGYAMQRYMMAASSRGAFPTKFNGGLFTVGEASDPDFRLWGSCYWNQNTRLLYWPLLATGDFDLLKPWFDMYLKALPLAKDRTLRYYHHGGAAFIETIYFWGLPRLCDFGWDNAGTEMVNPYIRCHTQGALEVIAQMLDEYDITQDAVFARRELLPVADAVMTYYDQHWKRGEDGKIRMSPAQALETYQRDAPNPTPDVAGLRSVLPRLLALPWSQTSRKQRDGWRRMLLDVPRLPIGTTAHGKLPPFGKGDPDGAPVVLPAGEYGAPANCENPELYVVFPYKLLGVGKPELSLARNTFAARLFRQDTCWGQDGPQSAILGLTTVAQRAAVHALTNYGNQRFRWFWTQGHDWIPDLDNGGAGMMTLELMLMQCDAESIRLLPAWPKDWTADFKLHAPHLTVVEGHVENGRITALKVTPASRRKDVVVASEAAGVPRCDATNADTRSRPRTAAVESASTCHQARAARVRRRR